VVIALRTREERLQRQFADLRILHEEIRMLHVLASRSPIDRESIYRQIVEVVARLTNGPRSRLALVPGYGDKPSVVAVWPPAGGESAGMEGPDATESCVCITLTGDAGTIGFIEIARAAHPEVDRDRANLVAVYARDAGLALEHIALRERLERLLLTEERTRIARELHDGLVQTLGAVAYRMEYYADTLAPDAIDSVRRGLETASTDVRDALRQTRLMIYGLRDVTREGDVRDHLRALLATVARETEMAISADLPTNVPVLPLASTETICAVAQEALQNVVKHAGADSVALALLVAHGSIELTVTDDGRGFETPTDDAESRPLRYGLLGMRERAARQGGALAIQTAPGMGTCVTLSLPLEGAA
jgi:signal transduction histidine kinase